MLLLRSSRSIFSIARNNKLQLAALPQLARGVVAASTPVGAFAGAARLQQSEKRQEKRFTTRSAQMAAAATETEELPEIQQEEHKQPPHPSTPQQKFRKDYAPPPYLVSNVHLNFDLREDVSTVTSRLHMLPNYGQLAAGAARPALTLDGRKDVKLVSVTVAGKKLEAGEYELTEKTLSLSGLPEGEFEIVIVTELKPQDNTLLEGLYKSSGNYCTQPPG
ncbi:hypothetical protein CHLRE_04g213251v5 [Chlamydomonas reinhardtii]|uniref:Uncharacterized protein n=1 Tax=Chlamydomonas reinhardtii TaxID=3055 RepID=A0A2K3DTW6_CHLRE|nr:uncharacterized protein CHLRE_04g213251v5 [Chlamydomonas reinhardtii]PNW83979.1 hypothetical protein CHLRE_04g213251v5 [Chlamydomonas reinhardtii]